MRLGGTPPSLQAPELLEHAISGSAVAALQQTPAKDSSWYAPTLSFPWRLLPVNEAVILELAPIFSKFILCWAPPVARPNEDKSEGSGNQGGGRNSDARMTAL